MENFDLAAYLTGGVENIVKDTSLREALQSRLFTALRSGEILTGEHSGGCVLFAQRAEVEAILNQEVCVNG